MQYKDLAKVALDMVSQVSVKCDDTSLEVGRRVRAMLAEIATGRLVVGTPVKDNDKQPGDEEKSEPRVNGAATLPHADREA